MKKYISLILAISMIFAVATIQTASVSAETNKKYIALTFDDGPNGTTCENILRTLRDFNVPATFFVIGERVNSSNQRTLKKMVNQGCQIASHSWNHADMKNWTYDQVVADFKKVSDAIYEQVQVRPTVMRLPNLTIPSFFYDNVDFPVPMMGGDGTSDWNQSVSTEERIQQVKKIACDGRIVLLHCFEGNDKTDEALQTIIPDLLADGYEFVTIDELFEKQNQEMTLDRQWSVVKRQPAPSTTTTTAPKKIKGDVNGDKKVNSLDLQAMLRLVADGKSGDLATCDIDNNGKFDILDLKALLQKIL